VSKDMRAMVIVVSPRSDQYRARAVECKLKAEEAREPEVRRQLIDLARQWRLLAEQAERHGW
jgi:hypothetical protein